MISLEDCIGLCGLTEEEVLALAEHEHLPETCATACAQYLLSQEHGSEKIRDMIVDDIRQAQLSGDKHMSDPAACLTPFPKDTPRGWPSNIPGASDFDCSEAVRTLKKHKPATDRTTIRSAHGDRDRPVDGGCPCSNLHRAEKGW